MVFTRARHNFWTTVSFQNLHNRTVAGKPANLAGDRKSGGYLQIINVNIHSELITTGDATSTTNDKMTLDK